MQSDDYHLDRALYYACRADRERLCSQVSSGNGRVYRCLYEQKFNTMMSPAVSYQAFLIFKTHTIT
jgi:Golgi apparatus protein 1